jgi:hypothetical protein
MTCLRLALVWTMSLAGLAAMETNTFPGENKDAGASRCGRWLERTINVVDSAPMSRQRDILVSATARSCNGVSETLRAAGAGYAKATSGRRQAQLLVDGAASVLNNRAHCSVVDPLARAGILLVTSCPLPGIGKNDASPDVIALMRAADYIFLNALMTSLTVHGEFNDSAFNYMLRFIVASAKLQDDLEEKRKNIPRK